ncbi:20938_t:CDS:2 [Rhizophagus irregularis]|nr:20938_t:CDS:2 [Rhizophagus irregularis]
MEQPSVTYCATQSVDYLSQTHKWTDTDVISSYKEICKQLDIVQEKLREEREQKAALQAQQSQRSQQESALRAEEKRLIRMKNALWKRMGQTHDIVQEELREEHEQKVKEN